MKISLLPLLTLLPLSMAAQAQTSDTLVVERPQKVVIIDTDSAHRIDIYGNSQSPDAHVSRTWGQDNFDETVETSDWGLSSVVLSRNHRAGQTEIVSSGLAFGFVTTQGGPAGLDVAMGKSYELSWDNVVSSRMRLGDKSYFSVGLGFGWKNFRMSHSNMFSVENGHVSLTDYPADMTSRKFSRIKVFSLRVPVEYCVKTPLGVFSIGPVVNVNTYASVKTRYKTAEGKRKLLDKNIHQVPVTIDIKAKYRLCDGVNIYAKYAPCHVIRSAYGPAFSSWSMGIELF